MRHYISLGLIILLSSCASTTNYYPKTVQSWRGGSVQDLSKKWGMPDDVASNEKGNTILIYKSSAYRPGIAANGPDCIAMFEVDKQKTIIGTKYVGKRCYRGEGFATYYSNPTSNHS